MGNNCKVDDKMYSDLRRQMQAILSFSNKYTFKHSQTTTKRHSEMKIRDASMNINEEEIALNDNFFNPDHEMTTKKELIASDQRMFEHIKALESQIQNANAHMINI